MSLKEQRAKQKEKKLQKKKKRQQQQNEQIIQNGNNVMKNDVKGKVNTKKGTLPNTIRQRTAARSR